MSSISNAGIVIGATVAAQLWERVDLGVALASASGALLLAILPMSLLRVEERH